MTIWTDQRNERLRALYDDGLSCSMIGAEMGVSRNAVIGKVHRMGLIRRGHIGNGKGPSLRSAEAKSKPRVRMVRANSNSTVQRIILTREPVELKALRCAEIVPLLIGLVDLEEHHCRYPYDGEDAVAYCGHAKTDGSYCLDHFALCHGAGTYSERAATLVPTLVLA